MEALNTNKPKIDIGKFIIETFKKTVSASRSRRVIFCIILFLQFFPVELVTRLTAQNYTDTYDGLIQKISDESLIKTFLGLTKYLLIIILIFKSPAERTGRRRFAKYSVLLGSLYIWALLDIFSSAAKLDDQEAKLEQESFKENSIPIYGKVVFASYKRDERYQKRLVPIAEKLSAQTNGYIVIVQLNDSIFPYHAPETGYNRFNDYTHDYYDTTYRTNIPRKIPDLSNCRQFIVEFPLSVELIPDLPAVDKYVKIRYDPIKNGIEMYTNPATAATPTYGSIPGIIRQWR